MDLDSPPSFGEVIKTLIGLGAAFVSFRGWRSGALSRLWENAIGVLAAPVERDLARRETRAVNYENDRLTAHNVELQTSLKVAEDEIKNLKAQVAVLLAGRSSTGSSGNGGGTPTKQ